MDFQMPVMDDYQATRILLVDRQIATESEVAGAMERMTERILGSLDWTWTRWRVVEWGRVD